MLRPICNSSLKICEGTSKSFTRNKVVQSGSILKPADKLKLYHKENKELFGPLLETSKEKKRRLKSAKNNKTAASENTDNHNGTDASKHYAVQSLGHRFCDSGFFNMDLFRQKMLQNIKLSVNYVQGFTNYVPARGFKTSAAGFATRSSPAEPGYSSDDKILQIKPHKNDYAEQYPSVTLILNKTMTDESRNALEKWKQERIAELGAEEFERFYRAQMALGTKFHSTLRNYFTQPRSQLRIEKDVEGVWNSVSDVLKHISSPKAIESNVVHPVLKYRGIFDAIADYEDKPTLIEWKKSDKLRKSITLTYDNPVQLAAYFGAVCNDLNYKHLNVRDALLVIAYTDGSKADAYHLSIDKLREHWAQWLSRLETYTNNHGKDAEKILKGGKRVFEEDIGNVK